MSALRIERQRGAWPAAPAPATLLKSGLLRSYSPRSTAATGRGLLTVNKK
jgi:hypothetical protein